MWEPTKNPAEHPFKKVSRLFPERLDFALVAPCTTTTGEAT
jgi:hypothetical protein